jgi:AraC family transcriptional regulator
MGQPAREPGFVTSMMAQLNSPTIGVYGPAESWAATVAIFDNPLGFHEESWVDASTETFIAWLVSGAEVHCARGLHSGAVFRPSDGSLSLTLRDTPHQYFADGACRAAHFYIDDKLLGSVSNSLGLSRPYTAQTLRDDLTFVQDIDLAKFLSSYAERAISVEKPSRVEMEARAVLIIERLLSRHHSVTKQDPRGGLAPRQLKRVTDYLIARLSEDVGLAELASIADLSPHHFCRAFKQSTGLPPHTWLTMRRMQVAQDMMIAHPNISLTEIALCVGYQGQAAFGTAFKRVTGATPSKWRHAQG